MTDPQPTSTDADILKDSENEPKALQESPMADVSKATSEHPVLFFDGVCGLCNRTVDFFLSRDSVGRFRFAPLQGETARDVLTSEVIDSLQTVVLIDGQGTHCRSAAIIRMLWGLGGFWKLAGWLLWLIPWPIRDLGYRLIARFRYRLFGKKETCRMPTAEERERFLL